MKISLVTFSGIRQAEELNGPGGSVPALAQALAEQGHEVELHTRAAGARWTATDEAFETTELFAGPERSLAETDLFGHLGEFAGALGRQLRDRRPDVVHSHGWLAGLATELAERPIGIPVMHTCYTRELSNRARNVRLGHRGDAERVRVEHAVAMGADQLVAASETEQELLVESGVPRNRVRIVPPGMPTGLDQPAPKPPSTDGTRRRVAVLGGARNVVASVRALTAVPGVDAAVVPTIESKHQLRQLRALVDGLGLSKRVTVHPPGSAGERVALLRDVDLAVCLRTDVPTGDHLRAMALGVPVVAGSPEIAEAVVDGTSGVHALTSNPRELARVLRRLLDDPPMRYALGIAGWDRAGSRYSWDRIASETVRCYERTAQHAGSRRLVSSAA